MTAESKLDDAPEISSSSQSSSVLGLIAGWSSSSRERLGLEKTWKISKNCVAIVGIKNRKKEKGGREKGTYVERPPDPSVQPQGFAGLFFSNTSAGDSIGISTYPRYRVQVLQPQDVGNAHVADVKPGGKQDRVMEPVVTVAVCRVVEDYPA